MEPAVEATIPTVMLTGAAGGLGQAVARHFAAAGATLALLDRDEARLARVLPDLAATGRHVLVAADVTDQASMHAASLRILAAVPRVDALVHVAGGFEMGEPAHALTRASWQRMLDVNAWSFVNATRDVVPAMCARGRGRVVAVSARVAAQGRAGMAAYVAAKSALQRLVEALAAEVGPQGVAVNSVAPTIIDTPANRAAMPGADRSAWVPPDVLARAIAFLASDAGGWVHGQHLAVGA